MCWIFRPHHANHPSSSLICRIQALYTFHLHCQNQTAVSVHGCGKYQILCLYLVSVPLSSTKIFLLSCSSQFLLAPVCGNISSQETCFSTVSPCAFSAAFELSTLLLLAQVISFHSLLKLTNTCFCSFLFTNTCFHPRILGILICKIPH